MGHAWPRGAIVCISPSFVVQLITFEFQLVAIFYKTGFERDVQITTQYIRHSLRGFLRCHEGSHIAQVYLIS